MSLYGMMRTSTSGMSAQGNRLSAVADNIANVNTTGYKRASTEFSALLLGSNCPGDYNSGAVSTTLRHAITEQGNLQGTTSITDLAISGNGFFVVTNAEGQPKLTRAGSFVPNGKGELVNAAGFRLMGYPADPSQPAPVINGYSDLVPVSFSKLAFIATPTTKGTFIANLPSSATVTPAANLPSANGATAAWAGKSSLVTYDNLGQTVVLDLYMAKTGAGTWEVSAYDRAKAAPGGGFPYTGGALATQNLTFDAQGKVTGAPSLGLTVPGGAALTIDLTQMSQLGTGYTVLAGTANGNPPSGVKLAEIAEDGTVYANYDNGLRVATYKIPLAHVTSPDQMSADSGGTFTPLSTSGEVQIGFPQTGGLGAIRSKTLEQSNVDLGTELTTMIDAQRSYSANSKVFQTGSELMDVLINLKR